ncbi:MAG TPA: LysR family transcriptional regulator, partial [Chloroflexota bacterium]|nr:LysR family transcriptional regulator [Chloroflexota bacterium]
MDLEQVRSFILAARLGSFTYAARERGLTQPGLSRQVQKLERELGVTLFDRQATELRLTPAGERFLCFAEEFVDAHARLLLEIRAVPSSLEGDLRIIASTTPGAFLVPRLVARFRERYPRVRPEIAIADSAAVVAALHERQWDIGFTGGPVRDPSLQATVVAEDEIVLAVPVHYPLAKRKQVSLADLTDVPFLDREEGSGTLQSLRAALAARRLTLPRRNVVMVLSSCQA